MEDVLKQKQYRAILSALGGGTVPREGLSHIAVGRAFEIDALLNDVDFIADGGCACRFIVGAYGSGKTFLVETIKEYTIGRGFLAAEVDLSPERCLVGTAAKKRGLATYREIVSNLSCSTKPTGGAVQSVLEQWIQNMFTEAAQSYQPYVSRYPNFENYVEHVVDQKLLEIEEMNYGDAFAEALRLFWEGSRTSDRHEASQKKRDAIRWLKGDISTSAEARKKIHTDVTVNDDNWFEIIKLWSTFSHIAGYKGLYLLIDELAYIANSLSSNTRQRNYEKILSIYNDLVQGRAMHLGVVFSATPKAIYDKSKGLYSYEAMKSRLNTGNYSGHFRNLASPIIKIQPLSKEENYILLEKIEEIHADLYRYKARITEEDLLSFIKYAYMKRETIAITPRTMIRDFIQILDIVRENPNEEMSNILLAYKFAADDQADFDSSI